MQPLLMEDNISSDPESAGCKQNEKRKSSKPVMEKRRRARINSSLNELKGILLEAMKKDSTRHSKLEKADILEMTVKYLRNVERQRLSVALSIDPTVVDKYKSGFNECRNEVMRFLSTCEGVNVDVRTRLLNHLEICHRSLTGPNTSFSRDIFGEHVSIPSQSPIKLAPACTQSNQMHFSAINLDQSGSTFQMQLPASTGSIPLPANLSTVSGMALNSHNRQEQTTNLQQQNPTTAVFLKGHLQIAPKQFSQTSTPGGNITVIMPSSQIGHTAYLSPVSINNQYQTVELVTARPVEVNNNLQDNSVTGVVPQISTENKGGNLSSFKSTSNPNKEHCKGDGKGDKTPNKKHTPNKRKIKKSNHIKEPNTKKVRHTQVPSKDSSVRHKRKEKCNKHDEKSFSGTHEFSLKRISTEIKADTSEECRSPVYFETHAKPPDNESSPWRPWFSTNIETAKTSEFS